MAIQLDPGGAAPQSPLLSSFPVDPALTDKAELALSHDLLLSGLSFVGSGSDAVPLLCQRLATLTRERATVQLFQTNALPDDSWSPNAAFALLREHEYVIHLRERFYGWLATSEEPELSPMLLKHLARLCSTLFFLYETTAFFTAQVQLSPHLLHHGLSERQRDVLTLMVEGQRDQQIAQTLSIEPSTVRKYRETLLNKLGVQSAQQAVFAAILTGLHHPLSTLAPLIVLDE